MKVKICGINKPEFASWANELGADYLGLLLGITHVAEDKIDTVTARRIISESGAPREKFVMVTHLTTANEISPILDELGLAAVQLHDAIPVSEMTVLRERFPELFIIKAVHVTSERAIAQAAELERYADAIILDSRTDTRLGGTGLTHDWSISKTICQTLSKPVFLAGGLTPDNVAAAISTVHPYAVDVNSGVETADGNKDYAAVKAFIQTAKRGG